jgi:hypothetical protein
VQVGEVEAGAQVRLVDRDFEAAAGEAAGGEVEQGCAPAW